MLLSGKAVLNSATFCMIHLTIKMQQVSRKNCIVQHILQQLSHIFSVADMCDKYNLDLLFTVIMQQIQGKIFLLHHVLQL